MKLFIDSILKLILRYKKAEILFQRVLILKSKKISVFPQI